MTNLVKCYDKETRKLIKIKHYYNIYHIKDIFQYWHDLSWFVVHQGYFSFTKIITMKSFLFIEIKSNFDLKIIGGKN